MKKKKVAILGGGIAGMSAAHELAERGFEVEIYEFKNDHCGGKARSVDVPNSARGNKKPLPGEHGFRFFPGFYKHINDTLKRIPYKKNKHGVYDNLIDASHGEIARYDAERIHVMTRMPRSFIEFRKSIETMLTVDLGFKEGEQFFYAQKLWQLLTSCPERRQEEYEKMSWWEYIDAAGKSEAYRLYMATGLTRTLVAARAEEVSAKTGGNILLQLMFDLAKPGKCNDRILNGPTNEVWLNPWLNYLTKELKVKYHFNSQVRSINCDDKQVISAIVRQGNKIKEVTADYYIAALPIEVISKLVDEPIIKLEPRMRKLIDLSLNTSWMNGMQFYLKKDIPIVHGHTIYIHTEWALTSISQKQFWSEVDLADYGDGKVKGVLSIDISDWFNEGIVYGKRACDCTLEEIKTEVWEQLKRSLNVNGKQVLNDEDLHSWFLDPSIVFPYNDQPNRPVNLEPLLINKKDTWKLRPDAVTGIPNLFLASDYVRTNTDLATMEGANEAARRAVNGIIAASGANVKPCKIWKLKEPAIFAPFRRYDRIRFKKNKPWNGGKLTTINFFMESVGKPVRKIVAKPVKKMLKTEV